MAVWEYTVSVWKFHNEEVYGHTTEEEKEKERVHLQGCIDMDYWLYQTDPFIVSLNLQLYLQRSHIRSGATCAETR